MAKSGVAGTTVIKCGKLYDGIHDELFEKREILVRENRIEKVGTSVCRDDALIIDLSDKTVTPGLIDAHVHLSYLYCDSYQTFQIIMLHIILRTAL